MGAAATSADLDLGVLLRPAASADFLVALAAGGAASAARRAAERRSVQALYPASSGNPDGVAGRGHPACCSQGPARPVRDGRELADDSAATGPAPGAGPPTAVCPLSVWSEEEPP